MCNQYSLGGLNCFNWQSHPLGGSFQATCVLSAPPKQHLWESNKEQRQKLQTWLPLEPEVKKKKKTEQQLPVNQGEIPPAPTAITAARKWLLSSVNSEDRGLGLGLESCGYCGGEVWGGDGAAVSGSFALARSGEVDVQLFVRWPKV